MQPCLFYQVMHGVRISSEFVKMNLRRDPGQWRREDYDARLLHVEGAFSTLAEKANAKADGRWSDGLVWIQQDLQQIQAVL